MLFCNHLHGLIVEEIFGCILPRPYDMSW